MPPADGDIERLAGLEHALDVRHGAEAGVDGVPVLGRGELDGRQVDEGGVGLVDRYYGLGGF